MRVFRRLAQMAIPLAVAALVCAGSPRNASAGDHGLLELVPPRAREQLGPLRLHDIAVRCYQSLYKMRIAGEPLYAYPTEDEWARMIPKPAFRACIERTLKDLGY